MEEISIAKLVLSPTRTYVPVVAKILEENRSAIHGLIHCSGGGQTKILNFVKNIHVIKDNLFSIPPLFSLIQSESKTEWKEMYKVFNMGHRFEIYCNEKDADRMIKIAGSFNIDAQIIGRCEKYSGKKLSIVNSGNTYIY
jgi:phosphoribosylformylglycinamidine cyclo-ligase